MSDFTFDELEELLDGIEWKLCEGQADDLTYPLRDKLRGMIAHFCDNNGHIYQFSGGPGYCENCGEKE